LQSQRIGVFGGTFDPVHNGHIELASIVKEQYELDKVFFIPNANPPHKEKDQLASYEHRVCMLKLALENHSDFIINNMESNSNQTSFTIDTLGKLKEKYPTDQFYFVLGTDNLKTIHKWKNAETLIEKNNFILVIREDVHFEELVETSKLSISALKKLKKCIIFISPINISSTKLRVMISRNEKIEKFVSEKVNDYMNQHKIYSK